MSWQVYVTDQLMLPGDMCSAGIYGLDGGEWAGEGPVRPKPNDVLRLVNIITGKDTDFNGIKIDGVSYLYLSHDPAEGSILLNRIAAPSDQEKYICSGFLAKSTFVFGVVVGNYKLGNCSKVTCRLRDYLKQSSTMSGWQGYVTDHLMKPGEMLSAGIYSSTDGSEWAGEGDYRPNSNDQVTTLVQAIEQKKILTGDVKINNMNYMFLGTDEDSIKLVSRQPVGEDKLCCLGYIANTCFIVGIVTNGKKGTCGSVTGKLKDYLKGQGY